MEIQDVKYNFLLHCTVLYCTVLYTMQQNPSQASRDSNTTEYATSMLAELTK